jgi:hypothetical protein
MLRSKGERLQLDGLLDSIVFSQRSLLGPLPHKNLLAVSQVFSKHRVDLEYVEHGYRDRFGIFDGGGVKGGHVCGAPALFFGIFSVGGVKGFEPPFTLLL